MEEVLVSVIMPAHNCGRFIQKAIRSVMQQDVPLELIVVDDGSTDETETILYAMKERYSNLFYCRQKKKAGAAASRNVGIARARGRYIAFLDADDWWELDKLKKQIFYIEKTGCVLCYTGRALYTEAGVPLNRVIQAPKKLSYQNLLHTNPIACSSVLVRAEALKTIPMEHEEIHEDYLTWLKILRRYGTACGINEPLLKTRLTSKGKSRKKWKTLRMTYGVYRYLGLDRWKAYFFTITHIFNSFGRYYIFAKKWTDGKVRKRKYIRQKIG